MKLAANTLLMYTTNLVKQPTTPRFRRVSTMNPNFKQCVSKLDGHKEFLQACGFKPSGNYMEWQGHTAEKDSEEEKTNKAVGDL